MTTLPSSSAAPAAEAPTSYSVSSSSDGAGISHALPPSLFYGDHTRPCDLARRLRGLGFAARVQRDRRVAFLLSPDTLAIEAVGPDACGLLWDLMHTLDVPPTLLIVAGGIRIFAYRITDPCGLPREIGGLRLLRSPDIAVMPGVLSVNLRTLVGRPSRLRALTSAEMIAALDALIGVEARDGNA